ncbi:protein FAM174C isoform X2 [Astyanax mexicanus]|uniref:Family with sequence similarity 174 member C n=2 Tax=Astyanax mexicanus TaxID=7994 RepID=A0A3B1KAL4_ASTMX|nr:protein FAM174C isoform X1 [Astyanax mexicanus]XP_022525416.1 protein FAM174C isoform X2 [Astyanax mexicanus]KAG9266714.1 putative membrane protein C19orf24 isoform X1 [Astyanax mexicanus]
MILCAVLSVCVLLVVALAEGPTTAVPRANSSRAAVQGAAVSGSTSKTKSENKAARNVTLNSLNLDGSMIQRALYVLIGITIIGVLYFLVRAVRLKKTTTQRKKYGLLSNYDDTVEMAQLESDEEDTTVYEAKSLRR